MRLNSPIKNIYYENGVRFVKVSLLCDVKPDIMPLTGEGIKDLLNTDFIAPGSIIMTINGDVAIKGEDRWGEWI